MAEESHEGPAESTDTAPVGNAKSNGQLLPEDIAKGAAGDERDQIRRVFERGEYPYKNKIRRPSYEKQKAELQVELLKVQEWVKTTDQRIVLLFEGRDAAGKGGTIKRFTEHLNPRGSRVVALEKPTDREKTQWYFQDRTNIVLRPSSQRRMTITGQGLIPRISFPLASRGACARFRHAPGIARKALQHTDGCQKSGAGNAGVENRGCESERDRSRLARCERKKKRHRHLAPQPHELRCCCFPPWRPSDQPAPTPVVPTPVQCNAEFQTRARG